MDYFTSFFYATGEMMSALHPYGLQKYGYIAVAVIALANFVFGALYMYSLGIFNEGGGSYTASMRYLKPTLSLVVAVMLIQDYVLTIVVSALSGGDQLLSILNALWPILVSALCDRRGAGRCHLVPHHSRARRIGHRWCSRCWASLCMLTVIMAVGLFIAHCQRRCRRGDRRSRPKSCTLGQALHAHADRFDERHGAL